MKIYKGIAAVAMTAVLALAVVGCSSNSNSGSDVPADNGEAAVPVQELAGRSGAVVVITPENSSATVDVTVAKEEELVIMTDFSENPGEGTAVVYQDGEELSSDYIYEGKGFSSTGFDPGDYTVEVNVPDATGTVWVFSYDTDSIDFMNMDLDEVMDLILSDIA